MTLNLKDQALSIRRAAGLREQGHVSSPEVDALCRVCGVQARETHKWDGPIVAMLDGPELILSPTLRHDWWRLLVVWACACRWLDEPTPSIVRQEAHLGDGTADAPLLPRSRELALWILAGDFCPTGTTDGDLVGLLGVPHLIALAWRRWVLHCSAEQRAWRETRAG